MQQDLQAQNLPRVYFQIRWGGQEDIMSLTDRTQF
jgi:hypothetical protein